MSGEFETYCRGADDRNQWESLLEPSLKESLCRRARLFDQGGKKDLGGANDVLGIDLALRWIEGLPCPGPIVFYSL